MRDGRKGMEVSIQVWARAIMALGVGYVWKYKNLCRREIGSFNDGDGNENGKTHNRFD